MGRKAPQRAKRPCLVSTCKDFAENQGYCDNHQDKIRKKDRERGTAHQRGYDHKWEVARAEFLELNPLCADHNKRGYVQIATVVDHITPHKGDKKLFWDKTNWQPLCKPCHDRKTQTEDRGGWNYQSQSSKANMQSINPFFEGDVAIPVTGHAFESLNCKVNDQFVVIKVESNSIEIEDADGFVTRLHHSHFKKQV